MDEKLISAVFNYPELYNVTIPDYRCTDSRASAWRNISIALGLPCECFSINISFSLVYHNFNDSYCLLGRRCPTPAIKDGKNSKKKTNMFLNGT